ncbi:MAG: hypothetical protein L0Z62_37905 [Gemmataceae bacterium]|nr:hypothetical protein [Gemmataceae bacterium]
MSSAHPNSRFWITSVVLTLALCSFVGCGPQMPKTYPAKGKVVMKGGKPWTGGETWITFQLKSDPSLVARGPVEKDGSFTLSTEMFGKQKPGAVEGEHTVMVDPPPPPGEALPIISTPYVMTKTYKVEPRDNNEFTIEVGQFGARSRMEGPGGR